MTLQFGLLSAFALAWLWGAIAYQIKIAREDAIGAARLQSENLARITAAHFSSFTQAIDLWFEHLRHEWNNHPAQFAEIVRQEKVLRTQFTVLQITVIAADGRVAFSNLTKPGKRIYLGDREYFKAHKDGRHDTLYISKPRIEFFSDKPTVQFTRPIYDARGKFNGVLVLSVLPEELNHLYPEVELGKDGAIALIYSDGTFLTRSRAYEKAVQLRTPTGPGTPAGGEASGTSILPNVIDGVERLISYRRIDPYPVIAVVGQPLENVLASYKQYRRNYVAGGILSTAMAFSLLFLTLSRLRQMESADVKLRQSEQRYRELFESSPDGIFIQIGHQIVLANDACARLLGFAQPADIIGKSGPEFNPPGIGEDALANLRVLEKNKVGVLRFEDKVLKADGSWVDVEVTAMPSMHEGRGALQFVLHDLTERKRAELAMTESDRRLRALIENTSDLVVVINRRGEMTYISPTIKQIMGYEPDEVLNRPISQFIHPDDLKAVLADMAVLAATAGMTYSADMRYRHKNGNWLTLSTVAKNALEEPLIAGIIVSARDVTGRKEMIRELQLKNAVLSTQQQVSPDAILVVNDQANIISYNQQFIELWNIPDELAAAGTDAPVLQSIARQTADPAAFASKVRYLYEHQDEENHEELLLKDGRTIERYSSSMIGPDDTYYGRVWFFRDISERKRTEHDLQQLNRALTALGQGNAALIHATDETHLLAEVCHIIVDIAGYRLAWIGYVEHDAEKTVHAVAYRGYDDEEMDHAKITWADNELGGGPVGKAIRTQELQIVRNALTDPAYAPWRENAIGLGYKSVLALPLKAEGAVFGVLSIYSAESGTFDQDEAKLLGNLADDLAFGITTLRMRAIHAQDAERQQQTMEAAVAAIAATVDMRDPYTAGHQRRVAELAVAIARELGLSEHEIRGIRLAGVVHDLGKITIPAEILTKPGHLSELEYEMIMTHAQAGYDILKEIDFPWPIAQIVYQHHEKLDGSGYPRGLTGENILQGAKILAVADTVEAMSSHRPYRPGLGLEAALAEIEKGRGQLYDAAMVDICLKLFKDKKFDFSTV